MRDRRGGFTLVEMLVVITIIGLMIGLFVLASGVVSRTRPLEDEANRFAARLSVARERAEIEARPYGAILAADGYRFVHWDVDRLLWVASDDDLLRPHTLPSDLEFALRIDARDVVLRSANKDDAPQLGVGADGEYTAFELRLRRPGEAQTEILVPDPEGGLLRRSEGATSGTP